MRKGEISVASRLIRRNAQNDILVIKEAFFGVERSHYRLFNDLRIVSSRNRNAITATESGRHFSVQFAVNIFEENFSRLVRHAQFRLQAVRLSPRNIEDPFILDKVDFQVRDVGVNFFDGFAGRRVSHSRGRAENVIFVDALNFEDVLQTRIKTVQSSHESFIATAITAISASAPIVLLIAAVILVVGWKRRTWRC